MSPASAKDFLLKLINQTDFKLNLAEANDLIQAYKWLYELDPEKGQAPKPVMRENVVTKKAKAKGK